MLIFAPLMGLLDLLLRRPRLPQDQITRLPRRVRLAIKPQAALMANDMTHLAALPGIADVNTDKRVPRDFYQHATNFFHHSEQYLREARVHLKLAEQPRMGEPGGCNACFVVPFGVSGVEALAIYRHIRSFPDFVQLADRLTHSANEQMQLIEQALPSGKSKDKLRPNGRAVAQGRLAYARLRKPCPFLHTETSRCRLGEMRPIVCRMHQTVTPSQWSDPADAHYPEQVKAVNIRPPLKIQAALLQLDRRMQMGFSPFLNAAVVQAAQLTQGRPIYEIGETPQALGPDGRLIPKANRNVAHAKKYTKAKHKK